jgi:hypothetical protein
VDKAHTDRLGQILGNDLSAIQPPWVPPNVKFEIDDVESPWVYQAPFDFIFCRYMTASIDDWPRLVRRVYECVKFIHQLSTRVD